LGRDVRPVSDLLSAASLLLAFVGLLYSAWYDEVKQAIKIDVPEHKEDREPAIEAVSAALRTRACPLAIASAALGILLLPDLVRVLWHALGTLLTYRVSALRVFDAVRTLYCVVAVTALWLAFHISGLALKLRVKLRKLSR